MLEGVVSKLLNAHLGEFLELDPEALKLSVWSGNVNLSNLALKPNALDFLQLPIQIKHGYVEKLKLEANWRHLTSRPVVIHIEGVYIEIEPRTNFEFNADKEKQNAIQKKFKRLEAAEELFLTSQAAEDKSYVEKLVEKVVDNIKINISNIHIRYTDKIDGRNIAFGIALPKLTAHTTDKTFSQTLQEKIFVEDAEFTYKRVELTNLFMYLNEFQPNQFTSKHISSTEIAQSLKPHHFLLNPVNGSLNLTVDKLFSNKQQERSRISEAINAILGPQFRIEAILQAISFSFNEFQYQNLLQLIARLTNSQEKIDQLVAKISSLFESFSGAKTGPNESPNSSKSVVSDAQRAYITLYKRQFNSMWLEKLSAEEATEKINIERRVNEQELAKTRLIAMKELKKELNNAVITTREAKEQESKGFFKKLFGKNKENKEQPNQLTEDDLAEILQQSSADPGLSSPRDIIVDLNLQLTELSLGLFDAQIKKILYFGASRGLAGVKIRPGSMLCSVKLATIDMIDYYTPSTAYPNIMKTQQSAENNAEPLLDILCELNPLERASDIYIAVKLLSETIVVSTPLLARCLKFFSPSVQLDLSVLSDWSSAQLAQFKRFYQQSLQESLAQHKSLELAVKIHAPTFVLPLECEKSTNADVLVVDLGTLTLSTEGIDKKLRQNLIKQLDSAEVQANQLDATTAEQLYDKFQLNLTKTQIFLSNQATLWPEDSKKFYLLEPFDVNFAIFNCITRDLNNLPDIKLAGELGLVQFKLSNTNYTKVMRLLQQFALLSQVNNKKIVNSEGKSETEQKPAVSRTKTENQLSLAEAELDMTALTTLLGSERAAQAALREIDVNNDGSITRGEFLEWRTKKTQQKLENQTLVVNFLVKSIQLLVLDDREVERNSPVEVISAVISGTVLNFTQKTYENVVQLTIKGLEIEDRQARSDSPSKSLLRANQLRRNNAAEQGFLTVNLVQKSVESPNFAAAPTDLAIKVGVGELNLLLEPSAVRRLGSFFLFVFLPAGNIGNYSNSTHSLLINLQPDIDLHIINGGNKGTEKNQPNSNVSYLEKVKLASEQLKSATSAGQGNRTVEHSKKARDWRRIIHFSANFAHLRVKLCVAEQNLAEILISGFQLDFRQFVHSLSVFLQLDHISVKDCTAAGNRFPYAITAGITATEQFSAKTPSTTLESLQKNQNSLVIVKFDTFSEQELNFPNYPAELHAKIHLIQATFLQRFVQELQLFVLSGEIALFLQEFQQFQLQNHENSINSPNQMISPGSNHSPSSPNDERKAELFQSNSFVKISLSLNEVSLVIPQSSSAEQYFYANIAAVQLQNSIEKDGEGRWKGQVYQQFTAKLTEFTIDSLLLHQNRKEQRIRLHLLDWKDSGVVVNLFQHRSLLDVQIIMPDIRVLFSPAQYHFCLSLLYMNLAEKPTLVRPAQLQTAPQLAKNGSASSPNAAATQSNPENGNNQLLSVKLALKRLELDLFEDFAPSVYVSSSSLATSAESLSQENERSSYSLVKFQIQNIVSDVELSQPSGAMELNAQVERLSLVDTSSAGGFIKGKAVLNEYRELLLIAKESEIHNQLISQQTQRQNIAETLPLLVKLNKTVDPRSNQAKTVINVALNNMRFAMGGVLLRLPAFFAPRPENEHAKQQSEIEKAISQATSATNSSSEEKNSMELSAAVTNNSSLGNKTQAAEAKLLDTTIIQVSMNHPVIQLLADPTSQFSSATLLTWQLQVTMQLNSYSTHNLLILQGKLLETKLFTTELLLKNNSIYINPQATPSQLLQPFTISLDLFLSTPILRNPNANLAIATCPINSAAAAVHHSQFSLPKSSIQVQIDSISVRFTYSNYILLMSSIEALSAATSGAAKVEDDKEIHTISVISAHSPASNTAAVTSPPPSEQLAVSNTTGVLEFKADLKELSIITDAEEEGKEGIALNTTFLSPKSAVSASEAEAAGGESSEVGKKQQNSLLSLFNDEDINVNIAQGVQMLLVNDAGSHEIPFARFNVAEIHAVLHSFAYTRSVGVGVEISADFWNSSLVSWEPLLERYSVNISVTQQIITPIATVLLNRLGASKDLFAKAGSSATDILAHREAAVSLLEADYSSQLTTEIKVSSEKTLNINVSHAMFTATMDILKLFTQQQQEKQQNSNNSRGGLRYSPQLTSERFSPYKLINCTEFPVQLTRLARLIDSKNSQNGAVRAELDRIISVAAHSTQSFDFPTAVPVELSSVGLSLVIENQRIVLPVTKLQLIREQLKLQNNQTALLISELYIENGVRIVRLRSSIGLHNHTNLNFQYKLSNSENPALIKPKEVYWLPLQASQADLSLTIRPSSHDSAQSSPIFDYSPAIALTSGRNPPSALQNRFICRRLLHNSGQNKATAAEFLTMSAAEIENNLVLALPGDFAATIVAELLYFTNSGRPKTVQKGEELQASNIYGSCYHIKALAVVENLLAEHCALGIIEYTQQSKQKTLIHELELFRGMKCPLYYALVATGNAHFAVKFPQFGSNYSSPSVSVPFTQVKSDLSAHLHEMIIHSEHFSTVCSDGAEFSSAVDCSLRHGSWRFFIHSPFWLFDMTGLGLIVSESHKLPCTNVDKFTKLMNSEKRTPAMFGWREQKDRESRGVYLSSAVALLSAGIDLRKEPNKVPWSDKISIDAVGSSSFISVPSVRTDSSASQPINDIGFAVSTAPGRFYRTKLLTLTPHYFIVNNLKVPIDIKQHKTTENSNFLSVAPGSQVSYTWPDANLSRLLLFRRSGPLFSDYSWCGAFDPNIVADTPMLVRHKSDNNLVWFCRVETRMQGSIVYVIIREYKQEIHALAALLPYKISNKCLHHTVRVRQLRSESSKDCSWLYIQPYSVFPYCWEHPLERGKIEIEFGINSSYGRQNENWANHMEIELDELKSLGKIELKPLVGDESATVQPIYLSVELVDAVRVLSISSLPNLEFLQAELEKKTGYTKRQLLQYQKFRRIEELKQLLRSLDDQQTQLQAKKIKENVRLNSLKQGDINRPKQVPATDTALLVQIEKIKNSPSSESYALVTFNGNKGKTQALKGSNPEFHRQFVFSANNVRYNTGCTIELWGKGIFSDDLLGKLEFSLYEYDDNVARKVTLPLSLAGKSGNNGNLEVDLIIWLIPPELEHQNATVTSVTALIAEQQRVYECVETELNHWQNKKLLAGGLTTEIKFFFRLQRLHGFEPVIAALPHAPGSIVARITSELTSRTYSVLLYSEENDITLAAAQQQRLQWLQPMIIHIPEDLLLQKSETLHVHVYFLPKADQTHAHSAEQELLLLHTSIPLLQVPEKSSPSSAKEGQKSEQTWLNRRIPFLIDYAGVAKSSVVDAVLSVERSGATIEDQRAEFAFHLDLQSIGLSLINHKPEEILYFSVAKIKLKFDQTLRQQMIELKIANIQLDNQSYKCVYPVVIGAAPVNIEQKQDLLQVSVAKSKKNAAEAVDSFQYVSVLLQALDIQVEEELIWTIVGYINEFSKQVEGENDRFDLGDRIIVKHLKEYKLVHSSAGTLFFQWLQIHPLAFNISFLAKPGLRDHMSNMIYNPFQIILSAAATALVDIRGSPIRLNGQTIINAMGTVPVIVGSLTQFYIQEVVLQWYKILGSLEFLGNPVALIGGLGSGVADFFYEPAKGLVKSPQDFGLGIAKGSISLLKNTFSSVFGAAAKITNSLGAGIAVLSFDDKFITKSAQRNQQQASNAVTGLADGLQSFGSSLIKGIAGVVVDPVKGAQKNGAKGFAKGVVTGLAGIMIKPTSGAIAGVAQTMQGIGNTANIFDTKTVVSRVRPQRFIPPSSNILTSYDLESATQHEIDRADKNKQKALAKQQEK
jgi:hypothetical protein